MVNSIEELNHVLQQGCNAIEADVTFAGNGTALYAYHGIPCDCFRVCDKSEKITDFLAYSRDITTPGHKNYTKRYSLLILDLKTSKLSDDHVKFTAGKSFAKLMSKYFFNGGKSDSHLNVLMSVDRVNDRRFIDGFNTEFRTSERMNNKIGWEISYDDPISVIENLWFDVRVIKNIWYSDGITNCLSLFRDQTRLIDIIRKRDGCNNARNPYCIRKVYQWTVDYKPQFRLALRRKVDGILTNEPRKLSEVLEESEFQNSFRLAQPEDDPWSVFKRN
ncbi:sphingomyelin phosphodiesterase-like protein [Leptotrombidium deliense]|uniref:Sphingomyelin phosphodiesterase-like protein n=1 Tax=Leptotrombidium deliense TaxID=299467 RepID=A0A443S2G6_9ACAR|nr:sphingomyelin phosphodiesterase-like protein [Leptotrombidium deliense]